MARSCLARAVRRGVAMLKHATGELFSIVSDYHYLGRYSLEKLHLFEKYQRSASPLRVAAVLVFTPLVTSVALFAINLMPLNDPSAGPRHNAAAFVRSAAAQALRAFFTLLPLKQALALSQREYSFKTITAIAVCTALTIEGVSITVAFTWRFPVPCSQMISLPVFVASVCSFNAVFASHTMRRLWRTRKLQLYVPVASIQLALFYTFLGLSVAFAHLTLTPQIFLVALFPLAKFLLKHVVWKYARLLHDISTDITICMLEISGSLYQTVCLQFVNSNWLSAWMLVADLLQAVHEIRSYMELDYLSDGRYTLQTALTIIESALGEPENLGRRASFSSVPSQHTEQEDALTSAVVSEAAQEMDFEFESFLRTKRLPFKPSQGPVDVSGHVDAVRSIYLPQSKRRLLNTKNSRRLMDLNREGSHASPGQTPNHQDMVSGHSATTSNITRRQPSEKKLGVIALIQPLQVLPLVLKETGTRIVRLLASPSTRKIYAAPDPVPTRSATSGCDPVLLLSLEPPVEGRLQPVLRRNFARRHSSSALRIDGVRIAHRHQARILEQTLQLLFASEVLLFAEYMEVVIPVLYALCLGNEWLSPNAKYNVVVMNMTTPRVLNEIWNALGYALLEMATLLAMYWFMKRRYGISAMYQLAFVLETYWMTLHGKLVGAFIVVFNAVTVHQGAAVILSA